MYWIKDKKLTKANSHMKNDVLFWIGKRHVDNKPAKMYWAYLYPSGYCVHGCQTKERIKQWLDDNIDRIEARIKELGL